MSETSPQSLSAIISQQAPTDGGSAPDSAGGQAVPQGIPSLQAVIENIGISPESASGDVSLPNGSSRADAQPVRQESTPVGQVSQASQDSQSQQAAQEQARLRQLLTQRGFEIPQSVATDDAIADLIAQQLDSTAALTSSEDYQAFLKWQAEQQKTATQAAAQQATAPPSQQPPQVEQSEVLSAISSGFVTYDSSSKKWVPTHATFTAHANAMNERDERTQQVKAKLATDPLGFIQQQVREAIQEALKSTTATQPATEIKEVLESFRQQQVQTQVAQIESWATQNSSRLYDAAGNQTQYYKLYETIYGDLTKADPTLDQRPLERHNEVIRRLQFAEQSFRPAAPAPAAQAAAATAKPATFLGSAAARTGGANRLSDYSGPARNSVAPQIPKGKSGLPSLHGIVTQMTALEEN